MSTSRQVLRSQENVSQANNGVAFNHPGSMVKAYAKAPNVPTEAEGPAPSPPKPPRTAFMCFKDSKRQEILLRYGLSEGSDELLRLMAKEWRGLSSIERAHWDEEARNDKVRYVQEKAQYKGPWSVPKRRAKKHPGAPKRPSSAFLKYSKQRRSVIKRDNPDMNNTDISRLLGEMWRNASPKEKATYQEEEVKERAIYKEKMKKWREEQAQLDAASRTSHKTVQKMADETYSQHPARTIHEEATYPKTFDKSFQQLTVEDAAEKADQRVVFRHSFGTTPLPPYRPSYEASYHPHPPAPYHRPPEYAYAPLAPIHESLPTTFLRPLPSQNLDDDDDLLHFGGNSNGYYSENLNFSFYPNGGYP